jgi:hypothetical protein
MPNRAERRKAEQRSVPDCLSWQDKSGPPEALGLAVIELCGKDTPERISRSLPPSGPLSGPSCFGLVRSRRLHPDLKFI